MLEARRERTASELVFGLLKTLMIGYRLWGIDSGVRLAELDDSECVGDSLSGVIAFLTGEGLVRVDETGTLRLTDLGARQLLCPTAAPPQLCFHPQSGTRTPAS